MLFNAHSLTNRLRTFSILDLVLCLTVFIFTVSNVFGLPRNGKIVFTRGADVWPSHIYVMNLDGTGLRRISSPTNVPIDADPAWSPDGQKIAFARSGFNDLPDIFVMNPDGSGLVQLTDGGPHTTYEQSVAPAWSPDGSKIAFLGTRNGQNVALYVMNTDGTDVRQLYPDVACCAPPSWSPDARQIAFSDYGHIKVIDLFRGSIRTIVSYVWYDWEPFAPAWSPDGSTIAYIQFPYPETDPVGEDFDLFLVNAETLQRRNLTNTPNVYETSPAWLPDGTGLVYSGGRCGFNCDSAIYSIRTDGTGKVQLTFPVGISDVQPTVQPIPLVRGTGRPLFDFDGDGRTDLAVWRPDEGRWYLNNSIGITQIDWGLQGDRIVAGDYDGDGKADAAVFRPSDNRWYRVHSLDGTIHETEWGLPGDKTVPSDYDGDGKQDLAVWRPSEGRWYINTNSGNHVFEWGLNGDTPVPGDYDNDGKADLAVFRNGQWWIRNPFTGAIRSAEWGLAGDIPVPADYDGDGKTDIAVFRPSEGRWYIQHSATGQIHTFFWGMSGDTPVPGDYDGDGKADLAVYRNGTWYVLGTTSGVIVTNWGLSGDVPVPAAIQP